MMGDRAIRQHEQMELAAPCLCAAAHLQVVMQQYIRVAASEAVVDWSQVQADFARDGALRDVAVLDTGLDDWPLVQAPAAHVPARAPERWMLRSGCK